VNRAFSQVELECYYAAGVADRLRTFFHIWARKEARLKARGLGMAQITEQSLNRIPVVDFTFGQSYVGAVAIEAREAQLPPPQLVRQSVTALSIGKKEVMPYRDADAGHAVASSKRKLAALERTEKNFHFE
jgi:hypothetical protein